MRNLNKKKSKLKESTSVLDKEGLADIYDDL